MRIGIEARALMAPASGIKTYVTELLRALPKADSDLEYKILEKGPLFSALLPLWLETTLPQKMGSFKPDVVHYTKAAVPRRKVAPTVVTVYDVIPELFPESQKPVARMLWPQMLRTASQVADRIITISDRSKNDLVARLDVNPEKIEVIKLAPARPLYAEHTHPVGDPHTDERYILYLGTIEPRKNIPLLIRAFSRIAKEIPHKLVIAGRIYKNKKEVYDEIAKSKFADRIEMIGSVSQEKRDQLYADADLFVYPSIYEGWGLPPQEAILAGTPAIVSDGGSLGEVGADVVPFTVDGIQTRMHDRGFEEAFANRMLELVTTPELHQQVLQRSKQEVLARGWLDVAKETAAVYRQVHAS